MTCAVDTMIAIWALKYFELRGKGAIADDKIVWSRMLLQLISDRKDELVFPAIAVAEYLVPFSPNDHGVQISKLQNLFFCPSFDIRAASVAADLLRRYRKLPADEQVVNRRQLKADIQIIATAKVAAAQRFYSHDKGCRKIASLLMQADDLPTTTGKFHLDQDIRDGNL